MTYGCALATNAHEMGHLLGDVPALLLVAVVLWVLLPSKEQRTAAARDADGISCKESAQSISDYADGATTKMLRCVSRQLALKSHCGGRPRHGWNPSNFGPGLKVGEAGREGQRLTPQRTIERLGASRRSNPIR